MPVRIEVEGDFSECGSLTVGPEEPEVSTCETSTSDDQLTVRWYLEDRLQDSVGTTVRVYVDNERVSARSESVRGTGPYYEEIPLTELPVGDSMTVVLEVDGESQRCGTVSVGARADDVEQTCSTDANEITTAETATLTINTFNNNPVEAEVSYELLANGNPLVGGGDSQHTVNVAGYGSSSEAYTIEFSESDEYNIETTLVSVE